MVFVLKDTLSIEDENMFKACRSVCLFPRAVRSEVPPPKVRKSPHLITIFSLTIGGIVSYLAYMYWATSVFSCVSGLDL